MLEQLLTSARGLLSDFADPFPYITWEKALVRLLFAIVLAGILGWERELRHRSAGLRTHILISLAACLFTLIAFDLAHFPAQTQANSDPLRLIEAVTSGVAFLAAGSIITSGGKVHGLTTGASMWMAGAIGLTCGVGNIALAMLASLLAVIVLWLMRIVFKSIAHPEPDDGD